MKPNHSILSLSVLALVALTSLSCSRARKVLAGSPPPPPLVDASSASYMAEMKAQRLQVTPSQSEYWVMPNGMQVMVVSQPSSTQAAVALRVGIGQYQEDFKRYRGLAHYLEHVLFLGSEKYPVPDEFMSFVERHKGNSNAYTAFEATKYFAYVASQNFEETVDRLSDFFVAPRFDTTSVEKELKAIQSEYDKNADNPDWQFYYLDRLPFKESHPHRWVFQGNRDTLSNIPRNVVVDFFNNNYSANNMVLVLVGPQSVAQLKTMATATFGRVPNRKLTPKPLPALVDSRAVPAQLIQSNIQQKSYYVTLTYTLPPVSNGYWLSKDFDLVGSVLADQRVGTFSYYLKDKGWLEAIEAGADTGSSVATQMTVRMKLTPEGFQHWQEISSGLMAYIEQLQKQGYNESVFKNVQRSAALGYVYGDRTVGDQVKELTEAIALYGGGVNSAERSALVVKSHPEGYRKALNSLQPKNLDVIVQSPDFKGAKTSDFYNMNYTSSNLSAESWYNSPKPLVGFAPTELTINPYLPQNLSLVKEQDTAPKVVLQNEVVQASLRRDHSFNRPLGNISVKLSTGPQILRTPEEAALAFVFKNYLVEALGSWAYTPADLGYKFDFQANSTGANIAFYGYSDRLPFYVHEFLTQTANLKIDPEMFATVKDNLQRGFANLQNGDAENQALLIRDLTFNPYGFTDRNLAEILAKITPEKLADFKARFFAAGQVSLMAVGSLTPEQVQTVASDIQSSLGIKATTEIKKSEAVKFPLGTSAYVVPRDGKNNTWYSLFQIGLPTAENQARVQLLGAIVGPEFFTYMRTDKQYGYIVAAVGSEFRPFSSLNFVIQTASPPLEVAAEGRRWLKENMLARLKSMDEKEFTSIKAGLMAKLKDKPESFEQFVDAIQKGFFLGNYSSQEDIAKALDLLTKDSITADFERLILGANRRELTVYVSSTQGGVALPTLPADEKAIENLQDYWRQTERW